MKPRPSFFSHLHPPTIPAQQARFRHTFGLGGISLLLFLVLCLTGALELFYYEPSLAGANASVQTLTFLVPFGGLVRSLHYWAAQLLVVSVCLHLLRVMLTGAYKAPRRFNWLLGLSLLFGVLLLDFTGYALRWDAHIGWALLVGTNLLKTIPLAGPVLYGMVVGGPELGASSLHPALRLAHFRSGRASVCRHCLALVSCPPRWRDRPAGRHRGRPPAAE